MATAINITGSRFHNLSDAMLADEIGRVDGISKAAEARRGCQEGCRDA